MRAYSSPLQYSADTKVLEGYSSWAVLSACSHFTPPVCSHFVTPVGAGSAGRRAADWSEVDVEAWEGQLQTWLTSVKVEEFRAWLLNLIREKQLQQQQHQQQQPEGRRTSSRRRAAAGS